MLPPAEELFNLVLGLPGICKGFAAEVETLLDYLWRTGECLKDRGQPGAK